MPHGKEIFCVLNCMNSLCADECFELNEFSVCWRTLKTFRTMDWNNYFDLNCSTVPTPFFNGLFWIPLDCVYPIPRWTLWIPLDCAYPVPWCTSWICECCPCAPSMMESISPSPFFCVVPWIKIKVSILGEGGCYIVSRRIYRHMWRQRKWP